VGRKQVFGCEAKLAGKGSQTVALCVGYLFLSIQINRELSSERFSWVAHNVECMQRAGVRGYFTIHRYCTCQRAMNL